MKRKRKPRGHAVDTLLQQVNEEFAGELQELVADYAAAYPDATPAERLQIDILVYSQWMCNCLSRVDTRIWNEEIASAENPDLALAEAWINRSADFMRVDRRTEAVSRDFYRALTELQRLRALRSAPRPVAAARQESESRATNAPKEKSSNLVRLPTSRWVM